MNQTAIRARLRLALALGALAVSAACAAHPPGSAGVISTEEVARIEQEIRDIEKSFNGAYERNDLATYWTFFSEDLSQFFDSGRVSLEQYKKDWTALIEGGGAILEARIDDLQVRVSPQGDAAGAAYRLFIRMRDPKGNETSTWYLESDTWFRRDTRWQVVQLHYSAEHPPAPPAAAAGDGAGTVASLRGRPDTCGHRTGEL